jgi:hypothetical protein
VSSILPGGYRDPARGRADAESERQADHPAAPASAGQIETGEPQAR